MTSTHPAVFLLVLSGCAGNQYHEPLEWSTMGAGCYARGLSDVLLLPDSISPTDIRIARLPDSSRGPGALVHFRQRLDGPFSQSTGEPQLFIAAGDWKSSCSIELPLDACPGASEVYSNLAAESIPIGFAFDKPEPLTVVHGDLYFLSSRDGQGNQIDWMYYGLGHPLKEAISSSLQQLEQCARPASEAFERSKL